MEILGIDIGGSGIKGAVVNTETGELAASRIRIATPSPSKPANVADIVADIVDHFDWNGMVGCGFPAPIHRGVVLTAANIHTKWVGVNAEELFSKRTGCRFSVINDADAAGLAEMKFGAGRDRFGVVLIITIGTGLGTSVFTDGILLPNLELGHVEIKGEDAELKASDAARKREKLTWQKWAVRFNRYLNHVESLLYPDLIILGGGASKKADKFLPYINIQAEITIAQLLNDAGIVGAALAVK
jgi:polyphosphate glucokinase